MMPNNNSVTGLNGKNWMAELANKRVDFLVAELKNGGRAMTFEELKKAVSKKHPGGQPIAEKVIKKVAYGVEQGVDMKSLDDVRNVLLPSGQGTKRWEGEREKKRLSLAGLDASGYKLCKRGHTRSPENLNKNGACKLCQAAYQQKRHQNQKMKTAPVKESGTNLEAVQENFKQVKTMRAPKLIKPVLRQLLITMNALQYGGLTASIEDGTLKYQFTPAMPKPLPPGTFEL